MIKGSIEANGSNNERQVTPLVTARLIPTVFQLVMMFRLLCCVKNSIVEHSFCVERFKNW